MSASGTDWVGQLIGDASFRVVRLLDTGGMAHVYLAEESRGGESVVVKTPRSDAGDSSLLARFEREIQAHQSIRHPHIMPLLDAGMHEGQPFVVLPYLEGGTLLNRMTRIRAHLTTLPIKVDGWLGSIAAALDFLHERHWLHHDVKPANVFFDRNGKAYLGDLGLSQKLHNDAESIPVSGTPRYMAPERLAGQAGTGRSDQFSLAVVLFECLAGRPLFAGETPQEVQASQASLDTRSWDRDLPLPRRLIGVLKRALSMEPAHRYASCQQLAVETQAALAIEHDTDEPATWSLVDDAPMPEVVVEEALPPVQRVPESLHVSVYPIPKARRSSGRAIWATIGLLIGVAGCLLTAFLISEAVRGHGAEDAELVQVRSELEKATSDRAVMEHQLREQERHRRQLESQLQELEKVSSQMPRIEKLLIEEKARGDSLRNELEKKIGSLEEQNRLHLKRLEVAEESLRLEAKAHQRETDNRILAEKDLIRWHKEALKEREKHASAMATIDQLLTQLERETLVRISTEAELRKLQSPASKSEGPKARTE